MISGVLAVLMGAWLWIPEFQPDADSSLSRVLDVELRECFRRDRLPLIATFGLAVGISLLFQGMTQFILSGLGYSDMFGGISAGVYQLAAAISGTAISSRIQHSGQLAVVLHWLHVLFAVSFVALCGIGFTDSPAAVHHVVVVVVMTLLGASLMGMLPFLLQQAVETAELASENAVSGLLYFVAMSVAASSTQVVSAVGSKTSLGVIGGFVLLELVLFWGCIPSGHNAMPPKLVVLGDHSPPEEVPILETKGESCAVSYYGQGEHADSS